jgi:hypothetical protein
MIYHDATLRYHECAKELELEEIIEGTNECGRWMMQTQRDEQAHTSKMKKGR